MNINCEAERFKALTQWFITPQGLDVSKHISYQLASMRSLLTGTTLLQFGNAGENVWLTALNYRYKWVMGAEQIYQHAHCIGAMEALPFDEESIDCIFLPFSLDISANKAIILDEIDRVLKSTGLLICVGVNALSIWGLWVKYCKQSLFGVYKGMPKTTFFIQHELFKRDYHQLYCESFYFIPPVVQKKWLNYLAFLNQIGKMIMPIPSAFYCMVWQKTTESYIKPLIITQYKKRKHRVKPMYQPACLSFLDEE